jgi:DNA/RNA endonuclease G (NUC1)
MAKKLNKLIARIVALEKTVSEFLAGTKPKAKRKSRKVTKAKSKKAKPPAKAVKRSKKNVASAKSAVARKPARISKRNVVKNAKKKTPKAVAASLTPKPVKRAAKKRTYKVSPPTLEQLAPSGAPEFVSPHD